MACEAHKNTWRKSGEPYIHHPLAVALICTDEIGLGTTAIISALLHDVVEDTEVSLKDIQKHFGKTVMNIIDGLTKIKGTFIGQRNSQQSENFRRLLLTLSKDARVILIKLADRLHNMRTLEGLPRSKQIKIASETIYLYAPLAYRLGLFEIKTELENLYLKYSEPQDYLSLSAKITQKRSVYAHFIRNFTRSIREKLKKNLIKAKIKARFKSIYSIWHKMREQEIIFDDIYDFFAIRIIIEVPLSREKETCWKAYSLITESYAPHPERLRDWISMPRSNGYEALHTTVMSPQGRWVEIQIRSTRMDKAAERGYAAHWKYKDDKLAPTENGSNLSLIENWIHDLRDALQNESHHDAGDFMQDFTSYLAGEDVYAFTPKGETRILPKGSSAIDFAFDIHTEVGLNCIGAKVNNKLESLDYVLKHGDMIEILTSTKKSVGSDWLSHAITAKARTSIRQQLRQKRNENVLKGRQLFKNHVKNLKMDLWKLRKGRLADFLQLRSMEEVYVQLAQGQISIHELKEFQQQAQEDNLEEKAVAKQQKDTLLFGSKLENMPYRLAVCCHPIPGDEVLGFITFHDGIKVHRTTCKNMPEILSQHGDKILRAVWFSQVKSQAMTTIKMHGIDRIGIAQDIMELLSLKLKVNSNYIHIEAKNGIFEGTIKIIVSHKDQLAYIVKQLKDVQGIEQITRSKT